MTRERADAGKVPSSAEIPVYSRIGIEIAEAEGVTVRTTDGRKLIDFYGGHAVALLGYRHPRLLEALREQAERLFFATNLVEVEVRRRAHDRLAAFAPAGLDRVFMVSTGAEANENALRIAFRMTGRSKVVVLERGFHGRTAAGGACTHGSERWYGFPRAPFDLERIPVDEAALDGAIDEDTAALILEPVQGQAGARDLPLDFVRRARHLTEQRGAWLIADEIQCGMGRSGHPFAIEASGVVPDVVATAKGLGGGFPVAAVITREEVTGVIGPGHLGTTFGGGPMAAALVIAVLDVLEEPGFLEHVGAMSAMIRERCRVGPVRDIQGMGLLLGLRVSRSPREVVAELLEKGIVAGVAGDPEIVRIMPPLVIQEEHVDALARALAGIAP